MVKQLKLLKDKRNKVIKKEDKTDTFKKEKKRKQGPMSMKDILDKWKKDPEREKSKKFVKYEYQDLGVRLAYKLNDIEHKSLYIKLAKNEKRGLLEEAYRFAVDYPEMKGKNKGKLFMWALAKLRKGEDLYTKKKDEEGS